MESKKILSFIKANPQILDERNYDVDMFEETQSCRWHKVFLSKPFVFDHMVMSTGGSPKDILDELNNNVVKVSDEEWDYMSHNGEPSDNYEVIERPLINKRKAN